MHCVQKGKQLMEYQISIGFPTWVAKTGNEDAGLECSFWIKDKSVWDQQRIILLYKATPPKLTHDRTRVTWPHLSHSRAFQWDIRTGFDPNPVESGIWASSTRKTRPCFILEMVLKDFWRKPTRRQSVDCRSTVDRQSADCVSTDSRSTVGR